MAYRVVAQVTVYWAGPGLGPMGGALAPSLPNAPAGGAVGRYFDAKYRVFHRLHEDQLAYRALMEEAHS